MTHQPTRTYGRNCEHVGGAALQAGEVGAGALCKLAIDAAPVIAG